MKTCCWSGERGSHDNTTDAEHSVSELKPAQNATNDELHSSICDLESIHSSSSVSSNDRTSGEQTLAKAGLRPQNDEDAQQKPTVSVDGRLLLLICFVSSPGRVFDVCGPICTGNATGLLGKSSGVMSELITMREAMHTDNAMTQRQLALMQDENRYRVSLSLLNHLEKN